MTYIRYQKLSDADVLNIQKALAQGARVADLARKYGVSQPHISQIKKGERKVSGHPTNGRAVVLTLADAEAVVAGYKALATIAIEHVEGCMKPLLELQTKQTLNIIERHLKREGYGYEEDKE